jgi:hypothetical protein
LQKEILRHEKNHSIILQMHRKLMEEHSDVPIKEQDLISQYGFNLATQGCIYTTMMRPIGQPLEGGLKVKIK